MKKTLVRFVSFALIFTALVALPSVSSAAQNDYTSPTDGTAPLQPDGSNQTVLSVTASSVGGGVTITAFNLVFSGTVVAADVAEVLMNINGALYGSTTSLGSWPNVTITGSTKPKNAVDIIIRLNPSAGGKTIGVTLQAEVPNSTGTGLPASTSTALAVAAAATPDVLSVASSTAVASSATPGQTNVQMLRLQLACANNDNGVCTINSITVNDLGTAVTGDIDNMAVYFDSDTDFANGTLGSVDHFTWTGTSTVVDTSATSGNAVLSGTPTYLWIVYDINSGATGKTIQASVTSMAMAGIDTFDNTGTPWNSSLLTVTAAASNILTSCADCHTYPPTDGASRNAVDGVVVGSHAKHYAISGVTCATCHVVPATETSVDFAHRNKNIQMQASINGGTYSKGTAFQQTNDLTGAALGTCSNVSCHYNNATPKWGSAGGTNCESCHNNGAGEPWPAVGGHNAHFAAFGVSAIDSTNSALVMSWCTICHTGAGSGSAKHADGNKYDVSIDPKYQDKSGGALAYSGGAAGTCSNVLCHGGNVSLPWNDPTGINVSTDCTFCHRTELTASEFNSATTGMHAITTTVSGRNHVTQSTNPVISCLDCHNGPPANHFYTAPASTVRSNLNLDSTAMDPLTNAEMVSGIVIGATADQTTCAMSCHLDNTANQADGPWPRLNNRAKASATDGSECDTCHGGVNGADTWTFVKQADAHNATDGKVEHFYSWDGDGTAEVLTSHSGCKTCHGWNKGDVNANYTLAADAYPMWRQSGDTTSLHGDGKITMNGEAGYDQANWNCTAACHQGAANAGHNLENSNWTVALGNFGAGGDCIGCHNTTHTNIPNNPVSQFSASYHHVTSVKASDCSVCHHANQKMDSSNPNVISLRNADTGAEILYSQSATDRGDLVTFCLSCHDANGATNSFNNTDGAIKDAIHPFSDDAVVPNVSQYWQATTTNNHTYSEATNNVVPQLTKARSAHGFPDTNALKQDAQSTYTNAQPVSCLECHPSHGSNTGSPQVDAGNYFRDTLPVGNKMMRTGYSEPNTCWSCHDAANVKDYYGDSTTPGTHWSGNQKSEFAYKQRPFASTHEVNGQGNGILCSICHNPHGASAGPQYYTPLLRDTWMTSPWFEDRACKLNPGGSGVLPIEYLGNGNQSTGNHQGPRVESTFAFNKAPKYGHGYGNSGGQGHDGFYIDENTFGIDTNNGFSTTRTINRITQNTTQFAGLCKRCHDGSGGTGSDTVFRDNLMGSVARTDFNSSSIHQTVKGWANADGSSADVVNPTNNPNMHQFQSPYTNKIRVWKNASYYTPDDGYNWGAFPSTTNQMANVATAYHQFACSKCHTPHASSLPRQMITNCLDVGTSATQRKAHGTEPAYNYPTWAATSWSGTAPVTNISELAMHCHNKRSTNTNGGGGWNKVTGW